ncbi:MAG: hypothetical protein A4E29_01055 [Methanomassiliicoccales archaeon PtaB.Bin134]|nr:MAG: hypothetical protein A4E29_01055 [Methanomassiliicoccales archaeon PtaB.Bin134]
MTNPATMVTLSLLPDHRNIQGSSTTLNILVSTPAKEATPEVKALPPRASSSGRTNRKVVTASSWAPIPNSMTPRGYAR